MTEQQTQYELVTVQSEDILANRQQEWAGFTKAITYAVAVVVFVLVAIKVLWG